MRSARIGRCLVAAALVVGGLAACGDDDDDGAAADPDACPTLPTKDPAAAMPGGLPPVSGDVLYEPSTQGKTKIVFELVDETDFVEVRDELVEKLKAQKWTIDGTDQESVEAEAQFSKSPPLVAGTIKVEPFCKGYVTVRYKLSE